MKPRFVRGFVRSFGNCLPVSTVCHGAMGVLAGAELVVAPARTVRALAGTGGEEGDHEDGEKVLGFHGEWVVDLFISYHSLRYLSST